MPEFTQLPCGGGTYALLCEAGGQACIQIGRFGALALMPGWYAYVGSAFGPGGLRARVGRHLRRDKPLRWHFDYLRPQSRRAPSGIWRLRSAANRHGRLRLRGCQARRCRWPDSVRRIIRARAIFSPSRPGLRC